MTESSKSKLWWFAGLFVRLGCVSLLGLMLWFALIAAFAKLNFYYLEDSAWLVATLILLTGYTWAIYFRFPFFQSRTGRQRLFISAGIAVPTVFLTCCCVLALLNAALIFAFPDKSDQRTESVTLPSGEVLENHTYRDGPSLGGSGERVNKLFLNNPAKGTSELVGDLGYPAEPNTPSLFAQSPHLQEFTYGNKKVLVIESYLCGSYLCKRINSPNAPYWEITSINADTEAQAYLKSFVPTNDIPSHQSPFENGLEGRVRFVFDSLDLTNNILTIKKQRPKEGENWDEFPPYLVYSALGRNKDSIYTFPSKFDIARTKAKNGPLWDNAIKP